jgi:hypothetical protein
MFSTASRSTLGPTYLFLPMDTEGSDCLCCLVVRVTGYRCEYYSRILIKKLRNSGDSRSNGRDSSRGPTEYRSRAKVRRDSEETGY